jgi:hypothetical protein
MKTQPKLTTSAYWRSSILYALFSILSLTAACSEDDEPTPEELLPPITQTGENTFGCLIDGELFKPRTGDGSFLGPVGARGVIIWGSEEVNVEFDVGDFQDARKGQMLIHLENAANLGEGYYEFGDSNGLRSLDGPDHNHMFYRRYEDDAGVYVRYVSFEGGGGLN